MNFFAIFFGGLLWVNGLIFQPNYLPNATASPLSFQQLSAESSEDFAPCGKIQFSTSIRRLSRNAVLYLDFKNDHINAAHVRLICNFQEKGVRRVEEHVQMSYLTFRLLLKQVDRIKPIGTFQRDENTNRVFGPIVQKTQHFSNAVVVHNAFSCDGASSPNACGVAKFDVYYRNEAKPDPNREPTTQSESQGFPTMRSILSLPSKVEAPKVSLQQALKLAEDFIAKERIDLSNRYLFSIEFYYKDVISKPIWRLFWVGLHTTPNVWIAVSMDGKARNYTLRPN